MRVVETFCSGPEVERLPPGKGEPSRPEASFAGGMATSLLKRRQQVLKPRNGDQKFINR